MATQIKIESFNYFGESEENFNAKVLYIKNGKLRLAHVYVDFFNKRVYFPAQPKECKVLSGLDSALKIRLGF